MMAMLAFGCGEDLTQALVDTPTQESPTEEFEQESFSVIKFQEGTTSSEALRLFQTNNNPDLEVTVVLPSYTSHRYVRKDSPENQQASILNQEIEFIKFISNQFDTEDELESVVYNELMETLLEIEQNSHVTVQSIKIKTADFQKFDIIPSLIQDIQIHDSIQNIGDTLNTRRDAITDFTDDRAYVPDGGSSTIWTSGSLQKFWFTSSQLSHYSSWRRGLEIDTLIIPRSRAGCGNNTSTNMPVSYKDTEAFDDGNARICTVGTSSANRLRPNRLYWTWHSFSSFEQGLNPTIQVLFQPTKRMWIGQAWAMFSDSHMPIQWLLQYNYNEAPGREVSWNHN